MTERRMTARHMPDRRWLAIIGAITLVGLALLLSSGSLTSDSISAFSTSAFMFLSQLHLTAAVFLIVGAFCYAHTRNSKILLLTLIWAGLNIVVGILPSVLPDAAFANLFSPAAVVLRVGQALLRISTFVPLVLLLSTHFQGRLERFRIVALALILGLPGLQALAIVLLHFFPRIYVAELVLDTLIMFALTAAMFMAAWCIAFRQMQPHHPPTDAGRILALICPRCHRPQQIALPAGECTDCRLQFAIALNEGICAKCHYPLRGLTGDRCPECGTPFVLPAPVGASQPSFTDRPG